MKTTIELPDALFRQIKSWTALRGQTLRSFVLEAVQSKLKRETESHQEPSWRVAFGKADPADVDSVQRVIDEAFASVEHEDWS